MIASRRTLLFSLFLLSGFCGLLYQVIWLRLAFASFGVITPVISVIVSVFMLGLATGSFVAGEWIGRIHKSARFSLFIYAGVEFAIGVGAFVVPPLFSYSESYLLRLGATESNQYLLISALLIAASLFPWCFCMGTTFPLIMDFVKRSTPDEEKSFSYLYLANVIGAFFGAILTAAVFVEVLGFKGSLSIGATINFTISALTLWMASQTKTPSSPSQARPATVNSPNAPVVTRFFTLFLFATGFSSMAMEVVWTRAFTPIMKTNVYAFAALLATYLAATAFGSFLYRRHQKNEKYFDFNFLLGALALTSLLPLLMNDPSVISNGLTVVLSLVPLCGLLGYLTPLVIDQQGRGSPKNVGRLYAVNVLGCIVGPLVAGYILLPLVGVKWSLVILSLPFFGFILLRRKYVPKFLVMSSVALLLVSSVVRTHEDPGFYENAIVRRDHTATIISHGSGMDKRLAVNGIGITNLTPVTKLMAHLPLGSLKHKPESILIICFGMGTTFRSAATWGIDVTAVELVPSVRDAFGYYHADAEQIYAQPNNKLVIDDGRRFLKRTDKMFDVVTLDPPPPINAAGSSLLYSTEFYDLVKMRLKPAGILQQWFPGGETRVLFAIYQSLIRSFPHIIVYRSNDGMGWHFLASMEPIEVPPANEWVRRLPIPAQKDLLEWYPGRTPNDVMREVLSKEANVASEFGSELANHTSITDDHPFNEYFLLRRIYGLLTGTFHKVN